MIDEATTPGYTGNEIKSQLQSRSMMTLLPLEMLQTGEWADVEEVHGEPAWVGRMSDLGLRIGARLQMVRSGSPCLLQVGDSRLSLRGDWAVQILVRPIAI